MQPGVTQTHGVSYEFGQSQPAAPLDPRGFTGAERSGSIPSRGAGERGIILAMQIQEFGERELEPNIESAGILRDV